MIAAIVPAAGQSIRMGRPKLILPIRGVPLMTRVVAALREGGCDCVLVVSPPDGAEETGPLVAAAWAAGARLVIPSHRPRDMRASIELGLSQLEQGEPPEAVLLAPGDSPGLSAAVVAKVISAGRAHPGQIVVPTVGPKRGHPLWLPWPLALSIRTLGPEVGVNALLSRWPLSVSPVEVEDSAVLADLDTPKDYRAWAD